VRRWGAEPSTQCRATAPAGFIHSMLPSAYGSTGRCCVRVALRPLTSKQCRTARLPSRLPSVDTFALRPYQLRLRPPRWQPKGCSAAALLIQILVARIQILAAHAERAVAILAVRQTTCSTAYDSLAQHTTRHCSACLSTVSGTGNCCMACTAATVQHCEDSAKSRTFHSGTGCTRLQRLM
jgi:hypothetical protein